MDGAAGSGADSFSLTGLKPAACLWSLKPECHVLLVRFPGVRGAQDAGAAAPQRIQGAAQAGEIN